MTRNFPRFALAWMDAAATPCALASMPVARNGCLTDRALAATGARAAITRAMLNEITTLRMSISLLPVWELRRAPPLRCFVRPLLQRGCPVIIYIRDSGGKIT